MNPVVEILAIAAVFFVVGYYAGWLHGTRRGWDEAHDQIIAAIEGRKETHGNANP